MKILLDISTGHGWELATALRGPDLPKSMPVKLFTTCQLRRCLGLHTSRGFDSRWDAIFIPTTASLDDFDTDAYSEYREHARVLFLSDDFSHFRSHFTAALRRACTRNYNRKGFRAARGLASKLIEHGFLPAYFLTR